YNSGGGYCKYYYNTINFDYSAAAGTATNVTYGLYQTTATTGIEIRNNIFSITRGGLSIKNCIRFNTATATFAGDRNVYYINSGTGTVNLGYFGGLDQLNLAAWQSATSQ